MIIRIIIVSIIILIHSLTSSPPVQGRSLLGAPTIAKRAVASVNCLDLPWVNVSRA